MKLLIAVGVIALMVGSFLFVKGPSPVIIVAPEHIFDIAGIGVTNTMFTSWIVVALLCLVAVIAGRGVSLVPSGFSGFVEAIVAGFYGIVVGFAGEENGRRFFWVIGTIFFYVLASNYFGLLPMNGIVGKVEPGHGHKQVEFKQTAVAGIPMSYIAIAPVQCEGAACPAAPGADAHGAPAKPDAAKPDAKAADHSADAKANEGKTFGLLAPYFRSVNTDVNAPLAIAIFSFIFVEFWGLSALGPSYLKKFFAFGALKKGPMGLIDVFVGLLEFVSELSRMVSFTFRLFGNVFAGEVLLAMMSFLVPFVLVDIFFGLELFVGLVQAFVFAMLTLVFAQTAVAHHGGDDHNEAHAEGHH